MYAYIIHTDIRAYIHMNASMLQSAMKEKTKSMRMVFECCVVVYSICRNGILAYVGICTYLYINIFEHFTYTLFFAIKIWIFQKLLMFVRILFTSSQKCIEPENWYYNSYVQFIATCIYPFIYPYSNWH